MSYEPPDGDWDRARGNALGTGCWLALALWGLALLVGLAFWHS